MYEEYHESTNQHRRRRRRRVQAIREIDETLAHIWQLPGFGGFQLPPAPEDLMAMAGEGPMVIFNCTEFRSDAIIVTSSGIKAVKPPRLVFSSEESLDKALAPPEIGILWGWWLDNIDRLGAKRSTYPLRNKKMEKFWLWDVAVEPVFEELQLAAEPRVGAVNDGLSDLHRIWWIGVGTLAMAPFHATLLDRHVTP